MDGMGDLFSAFPGFSPFCMINKSGTCATSRILQTRWMGCITGQAAAAAAAQLPPSSALPSLLWLPSAPPTPGASGPCHCCCLLAQP